MTRVRSRPRSPIGRFGRWALYAQQHCRATGPIFAKDVLRNDFTSVALRACMGAEDIAANTEATECLKS